ncbi:hypothetical protein OY671_002200 [Metschnikowia pulcherrima]|nr:hypothetical protein OY671_002200 [Metschnikowia pulcherrima]
MPTIATHMDHKSYVNPDFSERDSPIRFKPPSASLCRSSSGSPTSSSAGSMNYSPRHSHKPSSLSSSRRINIQRLSLNTSPESPATTSPSKRSKPLALFIPTAASPSMQTYAFAQTPIKEKHTSTELGLAQPLDTSDGSQSLESASDSHEPYLTKSDSVSSKRLRSPFKSGVDSLEDSHDELSDSLADLNIGVPSESHSGASDAPSPGCNSTISHKEHFTQDETRPKTTPKSLAVPEELQEIGFTYAYPHGPANVLNSVLYLYSDPETSERSIDINDYDLVINVAKECEDLSPAFDDRSGAKKYLRVPWSHTSTISKELPMITKEIAAMDKPGRKVLIHCQCGVSRSACVVVAYFMVKFKISVNEAYELLKSGTENKTESCSRQIKEEGNFVEACERICPNMSLIFELMDFGDRLEQDA